MDVQQNLAKILHGIHQAEKKSNREIGSTKLLAVSKGQSAEKIKQLFEAGVSDFGESYIQEALSKIPALSDLKINWHFIGNIQANKTKTIAQNFAWVHSVSRLKIAKRLNDQRPTELPPINICIEINIDNEATKSGVPAKDILEFAQSLQGFKNLNLRGLMVIPKHYADTEKQYAIFDRARQIYKDLQKNGVAVDTLSMGMSADYVQAIAAGSTIVRIGSVLFGARK
jgi:PLP dependent protein